MIKELGDSFSKQKKFRIFEQTLCTTNEYNSCENFDSSIQSHGKMLIFSWIIIIDRNIASVKKLSGSSNIWLTIEQDVMLFLHSVVR